MSTINKPPSTKPVEFKTVDGKIHRGFFLRDGKTRNGMRGSMMIVLLHGDM